MPSDVAGGGEQLDPRELYSENQLLGRLLKDMQAKLARSHEQERRLSQQLSRGEASMADVARELAELKQQHATTCAACTSAEHQLDRAAAARRQAELVAAELAERVQGQDALMRQLRERCEGLDAEVARMRASSITAEHVSQQLEKVEALYRSRVEAIKGDCRERLAAQDTAARARLAEAQEGTAELLARVKLAALLEVQRAEAFLEGKLDDQLRVLEQMSKRCRALEARAADMRPLAAAAAQARQQAGELAQRLEEAEAAAMETTGYACCCCCCCTGGGSGCSEGGAPQVTAVKVASPRASLDGAASYQDRIVGLRGELVAHAQSIAEMQLDAAAARQERVLVEERLEAAEATCLVLRTENVALRKQLVAVTADGHDAEANRQREATAHAAALQAAQADADAREMLEGARREQVATSRALLAQLRRVQTLEAMRLGDLQEIHTLERRLAALAQSKASRDAG